MLVVLLRCFAFFFCFWFSNGSFPKVNEIIKFSSNLKQITKNRGRNFKNFCEIPINPRVYRGPV
jgi:hypothetical protein